MFKPKYQKEGKLLIKGVNRFLNYRRDLLKDQLIEDINSPEVIAHIAASKNMAQSLGFTGTPAFVFGDALVSSFLPLSELQAQIAALRDAE